jgi:hypothetical protein
MADKVSNSIDDPTDAPPDPYVIGALYEDANSDVWLITNVIESDAGRFVRLSPLPYGKTVSVEYLDTVEGG